MTQHMCTSKQTTLRFTPAVFARVHLLVCALAMMPPVARSQRRTA